MLNRPVYQIAYSLERSPLQYLIYHTLVVISGSGVRHGLKKEKKEEEEEAKWIIHMYGVAD